MNSRKKNSRYERLSKQIKELIDKSSNNSISDMATIVAVLHNKMEYFFWTGFYLLHDQKLQVGPYQGSLACINLPAYTGVCWAAITNKETTIVDDVHSFPGHIACDSRSQSEIVIPLTNNDNIVTGVLDVDSKEKASFDVVDAFWLEKITRLISFD